ncbi:RING-H2 finger protein ATL52-like [Magnolia sinica]|uniref:RING-H2 finger protein ATL52-like n=1 Tax=Magnolia sinica TaxID=86752 RepID=UPI00265A02C2|nr:RING-H2 finger protein ATL52-like [Magnolia sinica]
MASAPSASSDWKGHFSTFYYSIVAVACTAILLMTVKFIAMGWCCLHRQNHRRFSEPLEDTISAPESYNGQSIPMHKYQKEDTHVGFSANECAVCLMAFFDGEDVRQLPECKHSYHAPCIDMWLFSHSNCPLCRATVTVPSVPCQAPVEGEDMHQGSTDPSDMA